METAYDAILLLSFGGPEGPDDVMPFLNNVLRGRNVPEERKLEVAEHYYSFGGVSPINAQCRELIAAMETEFAAYDIGLPIYWGNRNWHPMLTETMQQMADDGVTRALAFVTSAYSSYSGCRQYREDIAKAREAVGEHAPQVDKIRAFHNHPGFVEANVDALKTAVAEFAESSPPRVAFTAHSLPMGMADKCRYVDQLTATAELVAEAAGVPQWDLVYQSRSGPPHQPWLDPDICDWIEARHGEGLGELIIQPIGFISDHLEVVYDLDHEASELCAELGVRMVRAGTAGVHPAFVSMIRELVLERIADGEKRVVGTSPIVPDVCPPNCCMPR
jgi:ferrochelatase